MKKCLNLTLACVMALLLLLTCCVQGFAENAYGELRRGDKGEQVKALQERLAELEWYPMLCDGIFGPDMEAVVTDFNKLHGLDGSVATADMQAVAYSNAANPRGGDIEEKYISLSDIAEGTYTGILSGDSYANSKGTMFPDILPAELIVSISGEQITLYCEAQVSAAGLIGGKETPRSPCYTSIVSGTLSLTQVGSTLIHAIGDVSMLGESLSIHYDGEVFTNWEVKPRSEGATFSCEIFIVMVGGVPTAEIVVAGGKSYQTSTVSLRLKADGTQSITNNVYPFAWQEAEAPYVLWTNINAGAVQNDARDYYVSFELPDCTVTELETYHDLSGGKASGQIMLFCEDGSEYGPFQAEGRDAQDGVRNAYWFAKVNLDLPAGQYAIADSDQATWSNNDETDGWGMATVYGMVVYLTKK